MAQYYKFVTGELRDAYSGTVDYTNAIGKWLTLPENEIDRNGYACGRGFHLMKIPKPKYSRYEIGFLAVGKDKLGEDEEKIRFRSIKLIRPLQKSEIFFPKADLRGSNLRGSDLSGSNLSGSNLRRSNLHGSNLRGSDLSGSDLRGSDLSGSTLRGSNLSGSNLSGSNLNRAIMPDGTVYKSA